MSAPDDNAPVAEDEIVFRHIPVSTGWHTPGGSVLPQAFRPRDDDLTGLSLVRAEPYNTPEQAGAGKSKQGYWVAALRVGDIAKAGMTVVPRPLPGVIGHVEIPELKRDNRDTPQVIGFANVLASRCFAVHGPFVASQSGP